MRFLVIYLKMVKKTCIFLRYLIFHWFVLCLIALFIILRSCAIFKQTKIITNCSYNEPIDVVYTWVNGSDSKFQETLSEYIQSTKIKGDFSKQRFDDKNELKFSLRSIEKYAPWINHVYIVTNGQIPHWLNLDYEKVSIVTHNEIFKDLYNLPTFSSPAIESNLHRIAGLSKKFIYFNDDIFLNAPLYIEDFYSTNKGYSIYLAWNLPECSPNCPWLHVADGQCDAPCDTNKCQFDGGDCAEESIENDSDAIPDSFPSMQNWKFNMNDAKILNRSEENNRTAYSANTMKFLAGNRDRFSSVSNKSRMSFEMAYHRKLSNITMFNQRSITKIVDEHNRKTIKRNKIVKRKKRYLAMRDVYKNVIALLTLDGYTESLQYTQRLLNKKYGFHVRKVPAHSPILIDREIMENLQNKFPIEFKITERNRFRSIDDVQFSFSYYYFLMSEKVNRSIEQIFDLFDTDQSGSWSDRELRNLLAKMFELPLSYEIVEQFENVLLNCSELKKFPEITTPPFERYIDSRLPTISKQLVTECPHLVEQLKESFGSTSKYNYEIVHNPEMKYVTFKMLVSNVSHVVIELDEIRSKSTKFVCLNDNLSDMKSNDNDLIRALLYDFYISILPHRSKFELAEDSRNRFLYMNELNEWKWHHYNLKLILCFGVICLIFVTLFNLFRKVFCKCFNIFFN